MPSARMKRSASFFNSATYCAFVVRAESLEDFPHRGIPLVVPQRLLGGHPGGDPDGQDDVAILLAGRLAHDAAHGLHDVDDRFARREEHDRVEGGDVHPLGQAAGVDRKSVV